MSVVKLPVQVLLSAIEIKNILEADTAPTPSEGYQIIQLADLGYTKLWMEYKLAK